MTALSDQELLELCLTGEAQAWSEFVERFSGSIHGAIYATLRRYAPELIYRDRVRDFYQQAFLSLCENECRRLRTFTAKNKCSLAGWLRVVVSRMVIDELRKQNPPTIPLDPAPVNPEQSRTATANPPDNHPSPPELLESKEEMTFLRRELEELPSRELLIMRLRFSDGLSGKEVAQVLGISRNAVDQIVHRVKSRLKDRAREAGFE